jgi:nicotinamidase-related amidase
LQKRGVTQIVLAGVATSIGVEGTARDANVKGYNIAFVRDAMTDMEPGAHNNSLDIIFPRIGEIDTTDSVIAHLSQRK